MATSIPNPQLPAGIGQLDKVAHFAMYGVLAWLLARALTGGAVSARAIVVALLAVAAFGAADEWHQQFIPGRSEDVADWMADVSGATVGAALAALRRRTPSTP